MKCLISGVLAVTLSAALMTGQADASTWMYIDKLSAIRDLKPSSDAASGPRIVVMGWIGNSGVTTINSVGYEWFQWTGKSWKPINSATPAIKSLPAGQGEWVWAQLPLSNDAHRFKLVATDYDRGGAQKFMECDLKATKPAPKPAPTPAKRPTLRLIRLDCNETEDSGTDELELRIYMGTREFKLRNNMREGRSWGLNWTVPMDAPVRVELWELDSPDPDDKLGVHAIRPNSRGVKHHPIHGDGYRYKLYYQVDP